MAHLGRSAVSFSVIEAVRVCILLSVSLSVLFVAGALNTLEFFFGDDAPREAGEDWL